MKNHLKRKLNAHKFVLHTSRNFQISKFFDGNFLRISQIFAVFFCVLFSFSCENQQEEVAKEAEQAIVTNNKNDALASYMVQNDIGTLFVSQEQRKLANQNLNFVARFLAQFLNDEQFIDVFIEAAKQNLTDGNPSGILVEDFLKVYEINTGKSLLHQNSQYKNENDGISIFLSLVKGFSLETDKMQLIIKPRLYMPVLDSRFFKSYQRPKGIFAGHFYENSEKMALYSSNKDNSSSTKFVERKELSLSSNISVVGTYSLETKYFLYKKENEGVIINMMNKQCTCFQAGSDCSETGNHICLPWFGGNPWACGYAIEVPTCEGCLPDYECVPACCQIQ